MNKMISRPGKTDAKVGNKWRSESTLGSGVSPHPYIYVYPERLTSSTEFDPEGAFVYFVRSSLHIHNCVKPGSGGGSFEQECAFHSIRRWKQGAECA